MLKEFTQLQQSVETAKADFAGFERKDVQLREVCIFLWVP